MPPRFFWFVMGVGFSVAIENAYTMGAGWWRLALFVLGIGALLGLVLSVGAWFAWTLLEPVWSALIGWWRRRAESRSG
jgi:hypothetical protein